MAITYSAGILHPQLQPHPISADLAPPAGMVVVWVSTVTAPVTALVVVVGAEVVVPLLHSLQKSQFVTRPSPPTLVAHQEDPAKSMQACCSLGGEAPWQVLSRHALHFFMFPLASVTVAHQALFPVAWYSVHELYSTPLYRKGKIHFSYLEVTQVSRNGKTQDLPPLVVHS